MVISGSIRPGWHATRWLFIGLGGMLILTGGAPTGGTEPLSVICTFRDAVNAGDTDSALALFADNAVVSNTLGRQFVGRETIRGLIQSNVGAGIRLVPEDLQAIGDHVTWKVSEANSDYKKLGLTLVEMTTAVAVHGGRIESWTTYFALDILAKIEQGCGMPQATGIHLYGLSCEEFVAQARAHTQAILAIP